MLLPKFSRNIFAMIKKDKTILTEEERSVLICASTCKEGTHPNNYEIAKKLNIPVAKVKNLLHQICTKLKARTREQAIYIALFQGEISVGEIVSFEELVDWHCKLSPDTLRVIIKLLSQAEITERQLAEAEKRINLSQPSGAGVLTNREREVLAMTVMGFTNKEIATKLYMSVNSVRTYIYRASKKLNASKKRDAGLVAITRGELSVGECSTLRRTITILYPVRKQFVEAITPFLYDNAE